MDQDDLDFEGTPTAESVKDVERKMSTERHYAPALRTDTDDDSLNQFMRRTSISREMAESTISRSSILESNPSLQLSLDSDFPLWAGDTSARRSPEGLY